MGGQIAKYAFMPPPPAAAQRLAGDPRITLVPNSKGNNVAVLRSDARTPLDPARSFTIIFSHGNAEDLSNVGWYSQLARETGCDVIGYDYTGYGLSTGGEPTEDDTYACADAVYEHVITTLAVPPDDVILMGRSLGSGPTTYLAANHDSFAAVFYIAPLTSCAGVVGSTASFFLYPVDLFPNIRRIGKVQKSPVMILHGTRDEVIPIAHGKALAAEARKKNKHVATYWVGGAHHNDIEMVLGMDEFVRLVTSFLLKPSAPVASASCLTEEVSSWNCSMPVMCT